MHELVIKALKFAVERHDKQYRLGRGQPYINHSIDVMGRCAHFGFVEPETLAAAVLHDVVEDTYPATIEGINDGLHAILILFRSYVRDMVDSLTLPADCRTDHEKKLHYQKQQMLFSTDLVRAIKIADKTVNVTDLVDDPPPLWSPKQKLRYAVDARRVVMVATQQSSDPRIRAMAEAFDCAYTRLG